MANARWLCRNCHNPFVYCGATSCMTKLSQVSTASTGRQMRIIYGVSGEGSGHSSRARAMATHLREQGHEIRIVSYDRGYRALHTDFDSLEITGLHILSVDNKVSMPRTVWDNLRRLPQFIRSIGRLRRLFDEFRPDLVITD